MAWEVVTRFRVIFPGDGTIRRETWPETVWVDDDPLIEDEVIWVEPRDPVEPDPDPGDSMRQGIPRTPPVSPSREDDIPDFAVRRSTCDDRVDDACWFKDRMWMTAQEGGRFLMHKEQEGCRCQVDFYTYDEFQEYLKMHGTEEP